MSWLEAPLRQKRHPNPCLTPHKKVSRLLYTDGNQPFYFMTNLFPHTLNSLPETGSQPRTTCWHHNWEVSRFNGEPCVHGLSWEKHLAAGHLASRALLACAVLPPN